MASGEKKVLIFGKTGDGKSTVSNMLVSGNLASPKFQIGDGMVGVTSSCEEVEGRGYRVTDTVGLGEETESERKDAEELIFKYLKRTQGRYSHIIFVKRAGRFDTLDEAIWASFKKVFQGAEGAFMVVVTNCEDPERWKEANKEKLYDTYGRNMRYAFVNFPPVSQNERLENILKDDRQKSLDSLETAMNRLFTDNFERYFEPDYTGLNDLQLRARAAAIWDIIKPFFRALSRSSTWEKIYRKLWATSSSSS